MIGGLHHVSVNVHDIGAADHFYIRLLGLRRIERPELGFRGSWLEADNGLQIHLLELPGSLRPAGNHMAFAVDDIDATIDQLRSKGVHVPDWSDIGAGRQVFITDPSGNVIELNQPA